MAGACAAQSRPTTAVAAVGCPARIVTEQTTALPTGWTVDHAPGAKSLTEIGFFDGPVAERAQLAPTTTQTRGATTVNGWTFARPHGPLHIACFYRGTDVVLSRPLPAAIGSCSVSFDRATQAVKPEGLTCR